MKLQTTHEQEAEMERIRIQRAIEEYEEAKRQRQLEIQSMGLAGAVVVGGLLFALGMC